MVALFEHLFRRYFVNFDHLLSVASAQEQVSDQKKFLYDFSTLWF